MSRRRRDRGERSDNMLDELKQNDLGNPLAGAGETTSAAPIREMTGSEFADLVTSKVAHEGISKPLRANPVVIDRIYPDVSQPRRVMPSEIRRMYWNGEPSFGVMGRLFEMWLKEVGIERGTAFDLEAYLTGDATERAPYEIREDEALPMVGRDERKIGAKEGALLRVVALAASIYRDGLTNPITIVDMGERYVIETGERRWLAYHLLNWHFGGGLAPDKRDFSRIPARMVPRLSIWRQSSENNARADLNAIAKARQLALLLMDLHGMDRFGSFDSFEREQEFYAQVADGHEWRIPRGAGEKLLNAMGLSHVGQLRHYRRLLRLPAHVWTLADDLNWSEHFIQKNLLAKADNEDTLTKLADGYAYMLGAPGFNASALTESPQRDYTEPYRKPSPRMPSRLGQFALIVGTNISDWTEQFESLSTEERHVVLNHMRELLAALESYR